VEWKWRTSIPLATREFPRSPHIFWACCPVLFPAALNSSAGTCSLRLAVWRMARATCERTDGGSCSQYYCLIPFYSSSWYKSSQYPFYPNPPVCDLCSFSLIFASRWLDTLQTWLELPRSWFNYLEELPGISFWVCCFQFQLFHSHAFHLLLFIHFELSMYPSLQLLISLPFASLFYPDYCESLIRYVSISTRNLKCL